MIETSIDFGPQEIFSDNPARFFSEWCCHVNQAYIKGEVLPNVDQHTATVEHPDDLYQKWKLLNRAEKAILNKIVQQTAQRSFWRTASLLEVHGTKPKLLTVLYI